MNTFLEYPQFTFTKCIILFDSFGALEKKDLYVQNDQKL